MSLMRKMMFTVHHSELGFDETVAALKESAQKHGWTVPMTHDLQESYREAGYEDMTRVTTLYLCDPSGGYQILQDDANKPMAVMMPMGVTVYETHDREVYVAGMDLGRMSAMFGSPVKEVLRRGAANYAQTVADIGRPEPSQDIQIDGRRVLLGCVSLTAIGAALAGALVVIMVKVMPKLMSKMMPRIMARMEEAGVRPPCAQIILEEMEARQAE